MSGSNLPAGAEYDGSAPWNDKSDEHSISHLCPSCDDLGDAINELINEEDFEDYDKYLEEYEAIKDTALLCRECHRLDRYELD